MSAARCGTTSGWNAHKYRDEKPCDACAAAKREYDKRWRSAPERTRVSRLTAKAQRLALQRLKDEHPERYRELYAAAKAEVLADTT